jgi:hypothetical protein
MLKDETKKKLIKKTKRNYPNHLVKPVIWIIRLGQPNRKQIATNYEA